MTDYIEKMPNGLQTQIETDGLGLSNGEKQVISCLRGLLGIYQHILNIFKNWKRTGTLLNVHKIVQWIIKT